MLRLLDSYAPQITLLNTLASLSPWRLVIVTTWEEISMTHICMFLPEGLGSWPGAQTGRPHTGSCHRKSSGKFGLLFRKWKQRQWWVSLWSRRELITFTRRLTMIPDPTLTLYAVCIRQGTHTGVSAQTLPTVAHPSFTEVTHCPLVVQRKKGRHILRKGLWVNINNFLIKRAGCQEWTCHCTLYCVAVLESLLSYHHGHPSAVDSRMFDDTVWWLHALGFA